MKKLFLMTALLMALIFAGCDTDADDGDTDNADETDGINWTNESNGTLTVKNNTSMDIILFQGQTPVKANILGGVKASTTKAFDLADDVDDFETGGYVILRGITKTEYDANSANLSLAKVEYSAMALYGKGKEYLAEISPNYFGDFAFKVSNTSSYGVELRKDSPDGEKIAFIPALASNVSVYTKSSDAISILPVYVYYNKTSQELITIKPDSFADAVSVVPQIATGSINSYTFSGDLNTAHESSAYITVVNSASNQAAALTLAGSVVKSRDGYQSVSSGERLTFEIESTAAGSAKDLALTLFAGTLEIPVKFAGETGLPVIKNACEYVITLDSNGGSASSADGYTAVIKET